MNQRAYRVAAVQFEPEHGNKERNIRCLEALVRRAAAGGAKVIVTPEMATTGLFWSSREEIAPLVEPVPGATTERFAALARELDAYIVVGMGEVEPQTGAYYNTAVLVGPEGLVGRHRKVHAYMSEPMWAADGDLGFQVWETPLGRLGMMICMDANYPESGRLLALAGADVALMPVGWVIEMCPAPLWINQAFDNGLSAVVANRYGGERGFPSSGGSAVIDPDGSIQSCAGRGTEDEIVFGEIDLDDPRRSSHADDPALHPLDSRRPELYGALALNRYLWNPLAMNAHFGAGALPDGAQFRAVACESQTTLPVGAWLERLETLTGDEPQLFVLPEFSFTDAPKGAETARAVAETIPGATTAALEDWCGRSGQYVVAGLVEADGGQLYSTLVLVSPTGLVARYRKTHLSGAEMAWAAAGDRLVWADTPLGRIGLLAGTDLLYAEPARCLAIEGADVVCIPAALRAPLPIPRSALTGNPGDTAIHWHFARTRAAESEAVIVFANRSDGGFMGQSGIFFGPVLFAADAQEALASASLGNGVCAATMDVDTRSGDGVTPQNALRAKPGLSRRLPAQYAALLARERQNSVNHGF